MVVRRVLSDIVWGKEGSEEEMDGREEGPFTFRHYGGRREVKKKWMVGRRVLSLSDTMGEGGK